MRWARLFPGVVALGFCALVASSGESAAWGPQGHRLIAIFADHVLQQNDPAVRAKIVAILAGDTENHWTRTDIASEAVWADELRVKSPEAKVATTNWHSIEFRPADPDLTRDCFGQPALEPGMPASHGPQNDCIVDKIAEFARELHKSTISAGERLMAVQFLLNLVGQIEDPLATIDNGDEAGNCTAVIVVGGRIPVRLSTYWDETLVEDVAGRDPAIGAARVAAGVTPAEIKDWVAGSPADWARQSFDLAKSAIYAFPSAPPPAKYSFPAHAGIADRCGPVDVHRLDAAYESRARAAVKEQLAKAGIRLAYVLQSALK